jgi:hypothetical protein
MEHVLTPAHGDTPSPLCGIHQKGSFGDGIPPNVEGGSPGSVETTATTLTVASVEGDVASTQTLSKWASDHILDTKPDDLGVRAFGEDRAILQALDKDTVNGVKFLLLDQGEGEWVPLGKRYGPVKVRVKANYHKGSMASAIGVLLSPEVAQKVQKEEFKKGWNSTLRGVLFDEGDGRDGLRPVIWNHGSLEVQAKDVGLLFDEI